jgi:hypothetical protein
MPDIQTAMKQALSKTLVEWDDDDAPPLPSVKQPVSASVPPPSQNIQGIPMTKVFNVTNNISRVTFQYIKDNPGSTRKEIIAALEHQNFVGGSVSSLIAQMRRNKLIHETNNLYYADADEYRPLKSLKAIKKMEALAEPKPKRKYTKRAQTGVTGIGALLQAKLEAAPDRAASVPATEVSIGAKRATTIIRSRTPEDVVNNMTVYEARALYIHLKQLFGG